MKRTKIAKFRSHAFHSRMNLDRTQRVSNTEPEPGFWKKAQNPLVVSIVAATIAIAGNAGIAFLNNRSNMALEERRAEQQRIISVLAAPSADVAAGNIEFLLDTGLIKSPDIRRSLADYLLSRAPGDGPIVAKEAQLPELDIDTSWELGEVPPSFILIDVKNGKVIAQRAADQLENPATIAKLFLTYMVFERIKANDASLEEIISISENAASQPPSRLGVKQDEQYSLGELLDAAIVKGANDATVAIVDHYWGSASAFEQAAGEISRQIGLENSRLATPTALGDNAGSTSARDVAKLAIAIRREFPDLLYFFAQETKNIRGQLVRNVNRRMLAFDGITGMTTAYNARAGFGGVITFEQTDAELMLVVLQATSTSKRNSFAISMLEFGRDIVKYGRRGWKEEYLDILEYPDIELSVLPIGVSKGD